jgi:hypothetical protein
MDFQIHYLENGKIVEMPIYYDDINIAISDAMYYAKDFKKKIVNIKTKKVVWEKEVYNYPDFLK